MVEVEYEGEVEEEIECPHCKKKFKKLIGYSGYVDVDMSDFAPDRDY